MNVKTKASLDQSHRGCRGCFDSASFTDGEDGEREGSRMTSRCLAVFMLKAELLVETEKRSRVEVCLGCMGSKYTFVFVSVA